MSGTSRTVFVKPPLLMKWLSPRQRKEYIVLLDLEPDFLDEKVLRLDLDIAFNPISVRREGVVEADYYIGSTGAEIFLEVNNGIVRDYTPSQTLEVHYKNTAKYNRLSRLELKPSSNAAASITFEAGEERTFVSDFSGSEHTLKPICRKNDVRWLLAMPRVEKVVRDFIAGNLRLFGICECSSRISGKVYVRPSDIRFFDNKRKPLSNVGSLMMRYVLHKREYSSIRGRQGIGVSFEEAK